MDSREGADDVACHVREAAVSRSSSSREAGQAAAADGKWSTAAVRTVYRGLYGAARSRGDLCRPTSGATVVLLGR